MDTTAHTSEGRPGLAGRAARLRGLARASAAVAATSTVAGALLLAGGPAFAAAGAHHHTAAATSYTFTTLDDQADPTFNQLLGINSHNVIAGYFGSGAAGHPNKGYLLDPPYGQGNYVNENFPGSAQTQVTGHRQQGQHLRVLGVRQRHQPRVRGVERGVRLLQRPQDPAHGRVGQPAPGHQQRRASRSGSTTTPPATPTPTRSTRPPGCSPPSRSPVTVSTVATAISNTGDVAGFGTDASGVTTSWLLHAGHLTAYQFPGGSDTQAFGVNDHDEIVGSYLDGSGVMHGFTLKAPFGPVSHWQTIDDPNGIGSTLVNGLNDNGDLVGFYTDAAGNTDGMLATP